MEAILYPNFLNDPIEYQASTQYWSRMWQDVIRSADQPHTWQAPWFTNEYGDGSPCLDGNPIFSSVDKSRNIGVRIIQQPAEEDGIPIDWWIDFFGDKADPQAIRELTISLVLSNATATTAFDLLMDWVRGGRVGLPKVPCPPPDLVTLEKPLGELALGSRSCSAAIPLRTVRHTVSYGST